MDPSVPRKEGAEGAAPGGAGACALGEAGGSRGVGSAGRAEAWACEDFVDALDVLLGASVVPRDAAAAALEEALGHLWLTQAAADFHGISPSQPRL